MADKIELKITGDSKPLKKVIKKAEKLVDRFEKTAKNATKRRVVTEKRAHSLIAKVHKKTASQTIKTQKIAEKAIVKGVKSRTSREIAEVKKLESLKAAELRKSVAMDKRLSRKRARNRLKQMKSRQRAEIRREKAHTRRMRKIRAGIGRGVGRLGMVGGIGGLLGGIGLVFKAREILDFDVNLASLASQAKITKKSQLELRESMTDTAIATGVQRDVILDSIRRIVDKSGEFQLAADNVGKLAKVIRGTQVDPGALGETIAAMAFAFKGTKAPIFDFLEILIAQGDDASVTLQDLAANGEELMGAFKLAGLKTKKQFTDFFAMVQIAGGGGTSPEAATMMKNFIIQITKRGAKIEEMLGSKLKYPILKPGGGIRDVEGVVKDILQATGGDVEQILKLIPRFRGAMPLGLLAGEFFREGTTKQFDQLMKLGDKAGGIIERRYRRVAETPSQGFERLLAVITKLSDVLLLPALNTLSDSIIELVENKDKLNELVNIFKELGETLKIIAKTGATVANVVDPILKERRTRVALKKEVKELPFWERVRESARIGFAWDPGEERKRSLERIRMKKQFKSHGQKQIHARGPGINLNISNVFTKGGAEQTTTVEAQISSDRGLGLAGAM